MNYKVQEHLKPKALSGISSTPTWWASARAGAPSYVAAFLENIDWEVVEQRYRESEAGRFTARF
jgi:hypothetical protein